MVALPVVVITKKWVTGADVEAGKGSREQGVPNSGQLGL